DHPTYADQGLGLTRRSGPDQLLGSPAAARDTPARPAQAAATPTAARALPALRGTAAPRRPGATTPRRMGTVDQGRPQGDPSPGGRPRHATRDPRRTRRVQPHPHPLPTPPPRRHRGWTSTSALTFTPSGAHPSRLPGKRAW